MNDFGEHELIAFMDGFHEWWHISNRNTYVDLATRLMDLGVSQVDALNILESAFDAAADEYGG